MGRLAIEPGPRPLFLIGTPFHGLQHAAGNGRWRPFLADQRRTVDAAYQTALAHGGTSEGAPGLRPEYHEHYYGAYFRDTEGNKICVACHRAGDVGQWHSPMTGIDVPEAQATLAAQR